MATFIQRTAIVSIAKADRINSEKKQRIALAKEILVKNCTATANEIVKMALKEIDNYVNDIENSAKVYWEHNYGGRITVRIIFSKNQSKMIRSILSNNITEDVIKGFIDDAESSTDDVLSYNYLNDILNYQFKILGYSMCNNDGIITILKEQKFGVFLLINDLTVPGVHL